MPVRCFFFCKNSLGDYGRCPAKSVSVPVVVVPLGGACCLARSKGSFSRLPGFAGRRLKREGRGVGTKGEGKTHGQIEQQTRRGKETK